jgi:formate/nitrite transporter FocA (FNT family)
MLNGKALKIPQGVLDYIQKNGADAATWEPGKGVRQAMVGLLTNAASKNYVVIAGRSLRKTENRIATLGSQVAFGWVLSLLSVLVVVTMQQLVTKKLNLQ